MNNQMKKINKNLMFGWFLIVLVLFVAYTGEVLKGQRTVLYLIVYMIVTAGPAFFCLVRYKKQPNSSKLIYYVVIGYFIMYLFTLFTANTDMVFSYILPMLSLWVLYHEPKLIFFTGITSVLINIIYLLFKINRNELNVVNSKDAEIQIALLTLCFTGSYIATRLYNNITEKNELYIKELDEKNNEIKNLTLQSIMTIANVLDKKDEYTRGHSERVAEYSAILAKELGMSDEEVKNIHACGLLHDIGKISVSDSILNKPGKLTDDEYDYLKKHTVIGAEILKDLEILNGAYEVARYHHERYDGNGYPQGLCYDEIPYMARIVAVADAFDAMTSDRIYRRRLPDEVVMSELKNGIGTQFDPVIVTELIKMLEENRIEIISDNGDF